MAESLVTFSDGAEYCALQAEVNRALIAMIAMANAIGLRAAQLPSLSPVAEPGPAYVAVNCRDLNAKRLMVALVLGQSNAANHGETRASVPENVYSFYHGQCYRAQDPLPGASGSGGSVWTRLGPKIVKARWYDAVLFVPLGVESTAVAQWAQPGPLQQMLALSIDSLRQHGLVITHVLWHQGEADAKKRTSQADYRQRFLEMLGGIRSRGVAAPVYVSIATRCGATSSEAIRRAQRALVDPAHGIEQGPDTDVLGDEYRLQGCHFSERGLARVAELWFERLNNR